MDHILKKFSFLFDILVAKMKRKLKILFSQKSVFLSFLDNVYFGNFYFLDNVY